MAINPIPNFMLGLCLIRHECIKFVLSLSVFILLAFQPGFGIPVSTHTFHSLTVKDGLSNGTARTIVQDQYDFIWFGTKNGLNRCDGNNFIIFKEEPGNPNSLPGNSIKGLLADRGKDILWIKTLNGYLDSKKTDSLYVREKRQIGRAHV